MEINTGLNPFKGHVAVGTETHLIAGQPELQYDDLDPTFNKNPPHTFQIFMCTVTKPDFPCSSIT